MGFQQKLPGRCACASGVSTFGLRVCCPASGSVLSLPHSGAVSGRFSIVLRNCTGGIQKSFLRPILARFQPGGCCKFQHRPGVQIKDWRSVQIKDWCGAQVKGQGGVKIQRGRVHKWLCCHWRNSLLVPGCKGIMYYCLWLYPCCVCFVYTFAGLPRGGASTQEKP